MEVSTREMMLMAQLLRVIGMPMIRIRAVRMVRLAGISSVSEGLR